MPQHLRRLITIASFVVVVGVASTDAPAQSVDDRIDHEAFLEGLAEYGLDDLLEYYLDASGQDDPAMAAMVKIAQARARVLNPQSGESRAVRDDAMENLLTARRTLLQQFSHDKRFPIWQADLAFDLLFVAGGDGGMDLVAEFGVLDSARLDQCRAWGREAFDLANDATDGVADLVLDLEEGPDFATDAAAQQRHRFLVNVEQHQRLPLLLETARYRMTVLDEEIDPGEQRFALERVDSGLNAIADDLADPWRGRVMATIALSRARLDATSLAAETIERVLNTRGIDPTDQQRARLARVLMAGRESGAASALAHLTEMETIATMARDPFAALLIADQKFRWRLVERTGRRAVPPDRLPVIVYAIAGYDHFLANKTLGLTQAAREQLVSDRLASVIPAEAPDDAFPPFMMLARAEAMLRHPETHEEGLARLIGMRESGTAPATIQPRLLLTLAGTFQEAGRWRDAVDVLLEMASSFPQDERAPAAAQQAAILAKMIFQSAPDDESARSLYARALTLLVGQFPTMDGIDSWVYERGRFEQAYGKLDEAARLFRLIPSGRAIHVDAQFQLTVIARRRANEAVGSQAWNRSDTLEEVIKQAQRSRTIAERALIESDPDLKRLEDLRYYLNALDQIEAEAHWANGQAEPALLLLADFETRVGVARELRAEAVGLRFEIMRKTGHDTEADAQLLAFAEHEPRLALDLLARRTNDLQIRMAKLESAGRVDEMRSLAEKQAAPLCELAWATVLRVTDDPGERFPFRFRLAEVRRFAGLYRDAILLYEGVGAAHTNAADVLAGRAECYFALEKYAEAIPLYRRLVQGLAQSRTETYWLAELRSLEILDRVQRNTDQIYPRIQRLRQVDPNLGGARFTRPFTRLEQTYAP